jgi:hypothetical protein
MAHDNGILGRSHFRVLKLLASAPQGRADPKFIAVFTLELLELVKAGLVDVHADVLVTDGRPIKTARVSITAAGLRKIEE